MFTALPALSLSVSLSNIYQIPPRERHHLTDVSAPPVWLKTVRTQAELDQRPDRHNVPYTLEIALFPLPTVGRLTSYFPPLVHGRMGEGWDNFEFCSIQTFCCLRSCRWLEERLDETVMDVLQ